MDDILQDLIPPNEVRRYWYDGAELADACKPLAYTFAECNDTTNHVLNMHTDRGSGPILSSMIGKDLFSIDVSLGRDNRPHSRAASTHPSPTEMRPKT